jgi:3-hydroxyacyl-[acyl-carrier-protein] dehydratase
MNNPTPTTTAFSQEEEQRLRDSLRRCSAETIETAILYRQTKNIELASPIVIGILARFLEPELRNKLHGESDHLRLTEDLSVDSLTMVEIVMLVEEVLDIHIENEGLRQLRTIGDVKAYVNAVARGLPPPAPPKTVDIAEIVEAMPHQHPFLFIQTAELRTSEARGTYRISGDEFFLQGHFKNRPVFPASLLIEALGQLGVLLLLKGNVNGIEKPVDPETIFFTSCNGIRCSKICKPGDTLTLNVRTRRIKHPAAQFEGSVSINNERTAFVEEFTLTFDYAKPEPEPAPELAPTAPETNTAAPSAHAPAPAATPS